MQMDWQARTSAVLAKFLQMLRLMLLTVVLAGHTSLQAQDAGGNWDYVMRPGDTLIGLAERYFINPQTWPIVQEKNGIVDPYRIPAGTRISIPVHLLQLDPVVVEVLMVNGQASRRTAESNPIQPLLAGDFLRAGEEVEVAAASNVSLRFPDGSRLLVLENSRFTLEQADSIGDGELQRVRIALLEGNVESSVAPATNGAHQYEIRTPALRMSVRGTRFRSATDVLNGQSRSEVLAGRVKVSGGQRSIILGAGFGSYAAVGRSPAKPQTLLPAPVSVDGDGGATRPPRLISRLPLRFVWDSVADAGAYRAQVLDDSANLRLDGLFDDKVARWADLPDGRYTLRVRALGADGLEGLDAERVFILDARPEPPFARDPVGSAHGDPTRFGWTAGADDDRYHFQLAGDGDFSSLLVDEAALTSPGIERQLAPGSYFWRVARIDASGDHGPFGDAVLFEQRPIPMSPKTEAPQVGEESLSFRWQQGETGQRYQLQVARTPEFRELIVDQTTDQISAELPRPEPGDYYMRIKAIDADGFAGPFGRVERFTVEGSPKWWLMLFLLPFVL